MANQLNSYDVTNAALTVNVADMLADLGSIPAERIRSSAKASKPGQATVDDLAQAHAEGSHCELVDGILVEKEMGYRESLVAAVLIELLSSFVRSRNLGLVSGPDGFIQLFPSLIRGPDVAFTSWERLPNRRLPSDAYPTIVPDLVVEIISQGNTRAEMARKRREYFQAGVRLVWMVDILRRTVAVFTSSTESVVIREYESLDGGQVLPGLKISLEEVFTVLDGEEGQPKSSD